MFAKLARAAAPAAAAAAGTMFIMPTFAPVQAAASMFELSEADSMSADEQHYPREKVYKFTKEFAEKDYEDSSMLWRHARSAYQLATAPGTTAAEKTALLQEALTMIKSAVHLDGGDSESHRWFGTILQESSSSQGYSQQIADAFEVKSQWETAVTINPDDSAAQHLLGRWCLTVTDMPWYSRQLAATLFAEPPSSTYDEARDYFAAAERISPGFWKANVYFLGVVADRMGNREEALEWMVKAAALPVLTADDEEYQAKTLASLYSWDSAAYAKAKKAEDARVALKAQLAQ